MKGQTPRRDWSKAAPVRGNFERGPWLPARGALQPAQLRRPDAGPHRGRPVHRDHPRGQPRPGRRVQRPGRLRPHRACEPDAANRDEDDTHQPVWEQSFDGLRYAEISQVKVTLWDLDSGFNGDDDRLGTAESHGGRWHLGGALARRFELAMGADALSLSIRCRMPG